MKKTRSRHAPAGVKTAPPPPHPTERAAAAVAGFAIAAIPIAFWPLAEDSYRLTKALLFRASAIALLALAVVDLLWRGRRSWLRVRREPFLITAAAVVAWWGIAAVAASNRMLSLSAWLWVVCGAAIAVAVYFLAARRGLEALVPLVAGGIVNGISSLLAFVLPPSMWWPVDEHRAYALLGSAHDAGAFFVFPALAAIVAAVVDRRRRLWWSAAAAFPLAGIVATRTLGAAAACAAGVLVLLWLTNRRAALFATAALVLLAGAGLSSPTVRARIAGGGGLPKVLVADHLLSGRIVPFFAAARMFARHPLLGVGPGCFAWQYFDEKVAIEDQYPQLIQSESRYTQFGEAHSDHLQILAETGLPGYAIFIGGLLLLARVSWRRGAADDDVRARFARAAGAPLAAAIAVVALAEFPLELAAPTVAILYLAAICVAWSRIDALA